MSYESISGLNLAVGQARSKLHKLATMLESLSPENFALIEVALNEFDERFEGLLSRQGTVDTTTATAVVPFKTEEGEQLSFKDMLCRVLYYYCDDTIDSDKEILLDYGWDDLEITQGSYENMCRDFTRKIKLTVPHSLRWERVNSWSLLMWMGELYGHWTGSIMSLDSDTNVGQLNFTFLKHYWLVRENPKSFDPVLSNLTFGELEIKKDQYKDILNTAMIRLDVTPRNNDPIRRYNPKRTVAAFCDALIRLRE